MGKDSEVKNRTGRVLCSADTVHVINTPQLGYQESTNPGILKMARTVPMLTTTGGCPLSVDRMNSPNPRTLWNHRYARNLVKIAGSLNLLLLYTHKCNKELTVLTYIEKGSKVTRSDLNNRRLYSTRLHRLPNLPINPLDRHCPS